MRVLNLARRCRKALTPWDRALAARSGQGVAPGVAPLFTSTPAYYIKPRPPRAP